MKKTIFTNIWFWAFFLFLFICSAHARAVLDRTSANEFAGGIDWSVGLSQPDDFRAEGILLQFKVAGHVIGFQPKKVYITVPDQVLGIEFMGTVGVMPKAHMDGAMPDNITKSMSVGKVVYHDIWDGIDLIYEVTKDGIVESTYQIASGVDLSKVRLRYNVPVDVLKDGSLKLGFEGGFLSESSPVAWQDIDGRRLFVTVKYRISEGEVGFSASKYDARYPLTIDPIYQWHTFYGPTDDYYYYSDYGNAMAVDGSGNIYVTGVSDAGWQGDGNAGPLHAHFGHGPEMFVLKLDSSGQYKWHTFYMMNSKSESIAVDSSGNVYVTGQSDEDNPGDVNIPAALHPFTAGSGGDIFVLKLDSSGQYKWRTFYGSANDDSGIGITADTSGSVYVTGYSTASWQGDNNTSPINPRSGISDNDDIFVLKLDNSGLYQWHTFYGSENADIGNSVSVDGNGNVFVTGLSNGNWGSSPKNAYSGGANIFILKLLGSGQYEWNTFYGSSSSSSAQGNGIVADGSGNVYVTGYTHYGWQGNCGTPVHAFGDFWDIFTLKLNGLGQCQWVTFHGGDASNLPFTSHSGQAAAIDSSGNVYITGYSSASWQGDGNADPRYPYAGDSDVFFLKLDNSGHYRWHSFYGSLDADSGYGVALDEYGNMYIEGISYASWLVDASNPLHDYLGSVDDNLGQSQTGPNIFVLRMSLSTCPASAVKIVGEPTPYLTIQDAYNNAGISASLVIQALEFGDLSLLGNRIITLQGGFECDFLSNPGFATIHGKMTVRGGTVTVDRFIIR